MIYLYSTILTPPSPFICLLLSPSTSGSLIASTLSTPSLEAEESEDDLNPCGEQVTKRKNGFESKLLVPIFRRSFEVHYNIVITIEPNRCRFLHEYTMRRALGPCARKPRKRIEYTVEMDFSVHWGRFLVYHVALVVEPWVLRTTTCIGVP